MYVGLHIFNSTSVVRERVAKEVAAMKAKRPARCAGDIDQRALDAAAGGQERLKQRLLRFSSRVPVVGLRHVTEWYPCSAVSGH